MSKCSCGCQDYKDDYEASEDEYILLTERNISVGLIICDNNGHDSTAVVKQILRDGQMIIRWTDEQEASRWRIDAGWEICPEQTDNDSVAKPIKLGWNIVSTSGVRAPIVER
jgi:hypothetical protein